MGFALPAVAAVAALCGWANQSGAQEKSPAVKAKVNQLISEIVEPEVELDVALRRSKIVRAKQDIFRVAVADPSKVEIVAFGTREIEVIGKETGSTTVTLWLGDEEQVQTLSILVNVTRDRSVEDSRRKAYAELQRLVGGLFPNSRVQLIPIADKLVVRGQARDEREATQIMSLIRQNTFDLSGAPGFAQQTLQQGAAAVPFPDAVQLPSSTVINMLTVPGEKQVLLKVRIAEFQRSAVRQLGADFDFDIGDFFMASTLAGMGNILATGTFDSDSFNLVLNALASNGSAKILAEPNLVVLSGHTANFISGGEFAVPTVVGVGGAQAATTTFKGFGTQLTFQPTVLDKDRIRLTVSPSFSTLNRNNAVNGIFGVDTRSVNTTVELREGQVLAIAGLLQEQQRGDIQRVPLLGDIPLLNVLFANRVNSRDETELIILISPELVHALEPGEAPAILPGMEVTEPDDIEFYLFGNIEGHPGRDHRSTVWPIYRNRMQRFGRPCLSTERSNNYYIFGPSGLSN
jgi:pilus assembly protein CpaC